MNRLKQKLLIFTIIGFSVLLIGIGCSNAGNSEDTVSTSVLTFDPASGSYDSVIEVSISLNDGQYDQIVYTTDGSDPETWSTEYSNPILLDSETTIKAMAVDTWDYEESDIYTAEYTVTLPSYVIEGRYRNVDGNTPEFEIISDTLPPEVDYNSVDITQNTTQITISLSGLTISNLDLINSVTVEEQVSGEYTIFDEFLTEANNITDLGIVLVLDKSSSLGDDFPEVLEFSKGFIDKVDSATNGIAQIGLVSFAEAVEDHGSLTTDYDTLKNEIDTLTMVANTKFYDAIDTGLDKLIPLSVEGKALVAFTDGKDNYSSMSKDDLVANIGNNTDVKVLTIGLGDAVLPAVLEDIATNSDFTDIAPSIDELDDIFNSFADTVSSIYNLNYTRNDQTISDWRPIKITIK